MRLRKLENKDAPLMLEWMHDENVVANLQANFASKTLFDCENFIKTSRCDTSNVHMAIVDDNDIYMGTVSLKNIFEESAEFAITIRTCAMGKGYSKFAMSEIIRLGFEEYNLNKIYWCVSPDNKRACRFYDRNKYIKINIYDLEIYNIIKNSGYSESQIKRFYWYYIKNN